MNDWGAWRESFDRLDADAKESLERAAILLTCAFAGIGLFVMALVLN